MSQDKLVDYTSEIKGALKAQGIGKNVLILTKLESPVRRYDGKTASYRLDYRWLSQPCETPEDECYVCVLGNEFTYWQLKEVKESLKDGESLFDHFNLF